MPKTYTLTATGRRTTLSLLLGALVLWVTALWLLGDTLHLTLVHPTVTHPCTVGTLMRATLQHQPIETGFASHPCTAATVDQVVPGALLLVMVIALPLMAWNLVEEWSTRYTVTDAGLLYQTVGPIHVLYPWDAIVGLRRVDPQSVEPVDELVIDRQHRVQIRPLVLGWLHRLAFGLARVPLYAGITERDELVARIQRYSQLKPSAVGQGVPTPRRSL
ncbi:MAG: hypothetical protein H0X37_11590 [Herpetosiphonaceae bacterium]|nr:hypothetical protein [Herpetosiphonaceae bacterium]